MKKQYAPSFLATMQHVVLSKKAGVLGLFTVAILLLFASSASAAQPSLSQSSNPSHDQSVNSLATGAIDIVFTAVSSEVISGNPASFDVTVTNTGLIDLVNIAVTNTAVASCDHTVGDLTVGSAAYQYSCSSGNLTSDLSNTATARGQYGTTATLFAEDSDSASVTVVAPSIKITKTPANAYITSGDSVTFSITIENDGDVPLTSVDVPASGTNDCDKNIGNMAVGATDSYSCSATNVTSSYSDVTAVSGQYNGTTVNDSASTNVNVIGPSIEVRISTDTPHVATGDAARFSVEVENTGDVALANVAVDSNFNSCDNSFVSIAANVTKNYSCTKTNVTGNITNQVDATANSSVGNVAVSDSGNVDVVLKSPSLKLTKTAVDPTVSAGQSANIEIEVENNGDTQLTNVVVDDDIANCDATIGSLNVGEKNTYNCSTGALNAPLNNSQATAAGLYGPTNAYQVSDSDTASVGVVSPSILVEKTIPNEYVASGSNAVFSIVVTNNGDVPLTNIDVSDDTTASCDRTYASLAVSANETYSCTETNVTSSFTGEITAVGTYMTDDFSSDASVTVTVIDPSIEILITTTTPNVADGDTALFDITVNNTGDVALTNVSIDSNFNDCDNTYGNIGVSGSRNYSCSQTNVTANTLNLVEVTAESNPGAISVSDTDSAGVALTNPSITVTKTAVDSAVVAGQSAQIEIEVENDGDVQLTNVAVDDDIANCDKTIGTLNVGQKDTYTCSTGALNAPLNNSEATATGRYGPTNAYSVSDSDTASVGIVNPSILIEKTISNEYVINGENAVFSVKVTNNGDVPLTNIETTDDTTSSCDRTFAALGVGANQTYTCTETNVTANFTSEISVTADYTTETVNDDDQLTVTVIDPDVSITVTALTPIVVIGDTADFRIEIENTGDTPLTSLSITDALAPDCNNTYANLGAGATRTYTCERTNANADYTNSATVSGTTNPGGYTIEDTNTAAVDVIDPDVSITAQAVETPIVAGGTAAFRLTVRNEGDAPLSNLVVNSSNISDCNTNIASLAVNTSRVINCEQDGAANTVVNEVTVVARDVLNNSYNHSDDAEVFVNKPSIKLTVSANPTIINVGQTATFDVEVENTGNVRLIDVDVSAPDAATCNNDSLGALNVNQTKTYSCTVTGLVDDFRNDMSVSAEDNLDTQVSDTGSATVQVRNPKVSIEVTPSNQTVDENDDAMFTVTVINDGNVTLRNVEVVSDSVPDCTRNLPNIPEGDDASFVCTITVGQEDIFNNLTVNTLTSGISASDSTFAIVNVRKSLVIGLSPTVQTVAKGGTATFEVTVFNSGSKIMNNIEVSSDNTADNCTFTFSALPPMQSRTFPNCQLTNVQTSLVNKFTVSATPDGSSDPVVDTDFAIVNMVGFDLTITPDQTSFEFPGGVVKFTAVFQNSGNTELELGALTGSLIKGANNTTAPLLNNECLEGYNLSPSETYNCSFEVDVSGSSGQYRVEIEAAVSEVGGSISISANDISDITVDAPPITTLYLPSLYSSYQTPDEPNDVCSQAHQIPTNISFSFMPDDETDIYTFNLSSTSNVNIQVTNFTPEKGQIALFYGDCDGPPAFVANYGEDSTTKFLNLTNRPAGKYILLVVNDGSTSNTDPYNLIVSTP